MTMHCLVWHNGRWGLSEGIAAPESVEVVWAGRQGPCERVTDCRRNLGSNELEDGEGPGRERTQASHELGNAGECVWCSSVGQFLRLALLS